jgi:hypothetical protein
MQVLDLQRRFVRQNVTPGHGPTVDHGELRLAEILEARGLKFEYECYFYPLSFSDDGQTTFGFTPDFWIDESERWPELHIELTWADRDFYHPDPNTRGRAISCYRRKQGKIAQLRRRYHIEALLLTYRDWRQIVNHPEHLDKMIDNMLLGQSEQIQLTGA